MITSKRTLTGEQITVDEEPQAKVTEHVSGRDWHRATITGPGITSIADSKIEFLECGDLLTDLTLTNVQSRQCTIKAYTLTLEGSHLKSLEYRGSVACVLTLNNSRVDNLTIMPWYANIMGLFLSRPSIGWIDIKSALVACMYVNAEPLYTDGERFKIIDSFNAATGLFRFKHSLVCAGLKRFAQL